MMRFLRINSRLLRPIPYCFQEHLLNVEEFSFDSEQEQDRFFNRGSEQECMQCVSHAFLAETKMYSEI